MLSTTVAIPIWQLLAAGLVSAGIIVGFVVKVVKLEKQVEHFHLLSSSHLMAAIKAERKLGKALNKICLLRKQLLEDYANDN